MAHTKEMNVERLLGSIGARIDRLMEKTEFTETRTNIRAAIDRELHRIDNEVSVARARIDEDIADGREALANAFHDELDVWKARLDDLKVQADLGRMEVRDQISPLIRRLDNAILNLRHDVQRIGGSGDLTSDVKASVEDRMKTLRREIELAEEMS